MTNKNLNKGVAKPPSSDKRISFVIHRISGQLGRINNPIFSQHDLDLDTSRILVILLDKKMVRIGELIELMLKPQSTISHQLRRLESRGLVKRERMASDQRLIAVTLTKEGKKIAKEANKMSLKVYEAMVGDLDTEKYDLVQHELNAMLMRLKALEESEFK